MPFEGNRNILRKRGSPIPVTAQTAPLQLIGPHGSTLSLGIANLCRLLGYPRYT